ncbi:MAG TPA: glutathione S-transferase family protein [Polyangiaceae bacterium]|nr:glutathione S-transferase family protein [Polyangiaceae bacterium]
MTRAPLTIIGRHSSHYTRIVSIFAAELGLECAFEPVFDIRSTDARLFGENPLLRVPSLVTPEGVWFGSSNACRELARRSSSDVPLVWPEDHVTPLAANAQEITTDAMATGVVIATSRMNELADDAPALVKSFARLRGAVDWLEANLDVALAALPERRLSFLEVSSFCLLTHLGFRELSSIAEHPRLTAFCERFGARPSARATGYYFDRPSAPST